MEVNVKGVQYKVEIVEELRDKDDTVLDGQCDNVARVIKIAKIEEDREFVETVIHELTHAYLCQTGVLLERDEEEQIVRWFEKSFVQIMQNLFEIMFSFKIDVKRLLKFNSNVIDFVLKGE